MVLLSICECGCECEKRLRNNLRDLCLVYNMEGSTTRARTAEWEEEWVMCSCSLCKWQKKRRRRIALQHIKQHGEFDRQLFDEARRQGMVIHDVHVFVYWSLCLEIDHGYCTCIVS